MVRKAPKENSAPTYTRKKEQRRRKTEWRAQEKGRRNSRSGLGVESGAGPLTVLLQFGRRKICVFLLHKNIAGGKLAPKCRPETHFGCCSSTRWSYSLHEEEDEDLTLLLLLLLLLLVVVGLLVLESGSRRVFFLPQQAKLETRWKVENARKTARQTPPAMPKRTCMLLEKKATTSD